MSNEEATRPFGLGISDEDASLSELLAMLENEAKSKPENETEVPVETFSTPDPDPILHVVKEETAVLVMPKPRTDLQFNNWEAYEAVLAHPLIGKVYMWGGPSLGKSYTSMTCGLGGRKAYAVTLTQETPGAELRGHFVPKGGTFVWQDGVVVRAMREGARLVVNEFSHASEDVMALMYPILESKETARITLPSLEVVVPKPGFQVICTDNFPPDQMPAALRDRFQVCIEVKAPHPGALARLHARLRPLAEVSTVMEGERFISIRQWMAFQDLSDSFGDDFAAYAVFGDVKAANVLAALKIGKF